MRREIDIVASLAARTSMMALQQPILALAAFRRLFWLTLGLGILMWCPVHADSPAGIDLQARTLDYVLVPEMENGALSAVRLQMTVTANSEGRTRLRLPVSWGGGSDFYKKLDDLNIEGANTVESPSPMERLIVSEPGAYLLISYRVRKNISLGGNLPEATNYTYPSVGADWFYIVGPSFMASLPYESDLELRFSWNLPPGWAGVSSLPTDGSPFRSASESVFLAGRDVITTHIKLPHGSLTFATRGTFSVPRIEIQRSLYKILATEQEFWNEGQERFLVTLVPQDTKDLSKKSIRGSGLNDAFLMMATPELDPVVFKSILAHEYFHNWNLGMLGGFDADVDGRLQCWFSEGFTDYYGRKFALMSGEISATDFAALWNETLQAYATSPQKSAPNSAIADGFWADSDFRQLPYQRGAILAAKLDWKWRKSNKSLDGFMKVLRQQVLDDQSAGRSSLPLNARLERAAMSYGVAISDEIESHAERGVPIDLPTDSFGEKFEVITVNAPNFYLGYDQKKSASEGAFVDVDQEGPAFRAGIREGMKRIRGEGGKSGDSQTPITWHVIDTNGVARAITFKPEGKQQVAIQKLVVRSAPTSN